MTDIDGAWYLGATSEGECIRRHLSPDRRFLAVIVRGADALLRVEILGRFDDPQYLGLHWGRLSGPSITDTLENAERIVQSEFHERAHDDNAA